MPRMKRLPSGRARRACGPLSSALPCREAPPRLSSNAVLLSAGSSRSEDSRGRLDSTESYDYDNGAVVDPMATILDLTPEEQAQRIERTQSWDVTSPVIGPTASPLNPPVGAAPAERNNTPEPRAVPA